MGYIEGMNTLGARLRACRLNAKQTQEDVADAINSTGPHISNLENGQKQPSLELLAALAQHFQVTTDYLLMGIDGEDTQKTVDGIKSIESEIEFDTRLINVPEAHKRILVRVLEAIEASERESRNQAIEQILLGMFDQVSRLYSKRSANDLLSAMRLFVDAGDDSALRTWFRRFGTGDIPPKQN